MQIALITFLVAGVFVDIGYFDLFYLLIALIVVTKEQARERLPTPPPTGSASGTPNAVKWVYR